MDMSEAQISAVNRRLDRILDILENDERTDEKGLVTRVSDLTCEFHSFRTQYNIDQAIKRGRDIVWKIVWGIVGAGIGAGLWAFLKFLGSLLFKVTV